MNLGKYEILEELGRGGFGIVYKAKDIVLGRTIALKVLHPNLVNDPDFVNRFHQEARIAAKLDHPNLVPVHDFGEADGRYFIAMGYMPGGSLKDLLKREGKLSTDRALDILMQIAEGMEFAHSQDIIHRDLKPGNILFDQRGKARVSDLGFAKVLSSQASSSMSTTGGLVGTPAYMAPEIWKGISATTATDVYSLACILVEMVSGKPLFEGETTPEVMLKHFQPKTLPEDLPENWVGPIRQALAEKPEERCGDVGGFVESLSPKQTAASVPPSQPAKADTRPNEYRSFSARQDSLPSEKDQEPPWRQVEISETELPHRAPAVKAEKALGEYPDGEVKPAKVNLKGILHSLGVMLFAGALILLLVLTKMDASNQPTQVAVAPLPTKAEPAMPIASVQPAQAAVAPLPTEAEPTATIVSVQPSQVTATSVSEAMFDGSYLKLFSENPDTPNDRSMDNIHIYIQCFDCGNADYLVTDNTNKYDSLIWSPDGSIIAAIRNSTDLVIIDPVQETERVIANGDISNREISWSPDGQIIAYRDLGSLKAVMVDSGEIWTIVESSRIQSGHDSYPDVNSVSWSPTGEYLGFWTRMSTEGGNDERGWTIWTVKNDGTQLTKYSPPPGYGYMDFAWVLGESSFVFERFTMDSNNNRGSYELMTAELGSSEVRPRTTDYSIRLECYYPQERRCSADRLCGCYTWDRD